jgi:hypothetical protein
MAAELQITMRLSKKLQVANKPSKSEKMTI